MLLARQPGPLARVHLGRADHVRGVSAGPLPRRLITVAATLSGVVLTLIANAYLERRRAQDARERKAV